MSASMVSKYNDGLIKEGVSDRGRFFWTLHMEVEVGHSNAVFNVMEKQRIMVVFRDLFEQGPLRRRAPAAAVAQHLRRRPFRQLDAPGERQRAPLRAQEPAATARSAPSR
mgnify:CR=1 FL=1